MLNTMAIFDNALFTLHYRLTLFDEACYSDTAGLNIKVFATIPTVFMPSAFTPKNEGHNYVVKPVAVGMKRIEYFSIYNRWGDLVFTTSTNEHGWDGRVGGRDQG